MEDQTLERSEPIRSRWTPKPEQILILDFIFNRGMINPSKYETVKIRKLLEKFGSVGDAYVFYWFQNRCSRSRRRQRQLQASLATGSSEQQRNSHHHHHQGQQQVLSGGAIQYDCTVAATNAPMGFAPSPQSFASLLFINPYM